MRIPPPVPDRREHDAGCLDVRLDAGWIGDHIHVPARELEHFAWRSAADDPQTRSRLPGSHGGHDLARQPKCGIAVREMGEVADEQDGVGIFAAGIGRRWRRQAERVDPHSGRDFGRELCDRASVALGERLQQVKAPPRPPLEPAPASPVHLSERPAKPNARRTRSPVSAPRPSDLMLGQDARHACGKAQDGHRTVLDGDDVERPRGKPIECRLDLRRGEPDSAPRP